MSIFNIILGIVLLITSVFATLANMSPSQSKRQARIGMVTIILLITYFVYIFTTDSSVLMGYFLGLGAFWPLFIAYFINKKAIEEPIGYSSPHGPMLVVALAMILMTVISLIPNTYTYPEMKPIIDSDYLISRGGMLFMFVPATIFYILIAIKRTVIHKQGLFHDGLLWAWSDFESYKWKSGKRDNKQIGLILSTKSRWFSHLIKLKIDAGQKDLLEGLLAKEVR